MFMDMVRDRIRGKGERVVYPEGFEERAMRAAAILKGGDYARPILLGDPDALRASARRLGIPIDTVEIVDPRASEFMGRYIEVYAELRKHKGMTTEGARAAMQKPHYFGAMMVREGQADGMVSGLNSETKPFVPAFEIVGLREGMTRASSVFVMAWRERMLFFSDCAVNIRPDAQTLASIARATAASARICGLDPKVAMLSFSTHGSAKDDSVDRVREALRIVRAAEPTLAIDGEIQFDAAFVPAVFEKKCPDSPLRGEANVFIFPDINAGNIGYKLTERLGGARAHGPILQGLRKPVNDVSRGVTVEDLAGMGMITAAIASYWRSVTSR